MNKVKYRLEKRWNKLEEKSPPEIVGAMLERAGRIRITQGASGCHDLQAEGCDSGTV